MARPHSEAQLSLRDGGGRSRGESFDLHDALGPDGGARGLGERHGHSSHRACYGVTQSGHGMGRGKLRRSEEHTSELQSLMRISYAVFCLKKKTKEKNNNITTYT